MKRLRQNLAFVTTRKLLAARAVANYSLVTLGRPVLRLLDLEVTYRCPCLCEQCYANQPMPDDDPELSVAEIGDLVEQARKLGALQVLLSGGEPLVRRDLREILQACQPHRMLVTMCTSGVGLTHERVVDLADAGLAVLVFSVDSLDPAVHDRNRGVAGLHARVLAAAIAAREVGMRVIFNTVATREKLAGEEIYRLADLATRHGATLNLTIPTPQGRWHEDDRVALRPADRVRLRTALQHANIRTDVDSAYGRRRCPAAVEKISVDPFGNVRACPLLPAAWGNVRAELLRTLWASMRAHPGLAKRTTFCPAADPAFRKTYSDLFSEGVMS